MQDLGRFAGPAGADRGLTGGICRWQIPKSCMIDLEGRAKRRGIPAGSQVLHDRLGKVRGSWALGAEDAVGELGGQVGDGGAAGGRGRRVEHPAYEG